MERKRKEGIATPREEEKALTVKISQKKLNISNNKLLLQSD